MRNKIRPKSKDAHKDWDELEIVLSQLERELLLEEWNNEIPRRCKKWEMGEIFTNLEGSDQVIIPTDKINSFRSASTNKYMTMVNEHLGISANEIYRDKLRAIFEKRNRNSG